MARGINKVTLIGNTGMDPEVRYMPSGNPVANITIATSEAWKDTKTGEQQERTEWHRVVFFNRLAEIVKTYVTKGAKLYIEGALRTRQWEQDGVKRYTTEIIASVIQMLDNKKSSNGQNSPKRSIKNTNTAQYAEDASLVESKNDSDDSFVDDDIPF